MKIVISTTVSMPIYEQIINQIRDAVVSGELKAGDGMPSIRVLAKELAVSVITTKRAYEELEKEGVIESVPGRGFYVCEQKNDLLREKQMMNLENRMSELLAEFSKKTVQTLGGVEISNKGERFCIAIPPSGVDYVHEHTNGSEFISSFIETIGKHGCTIDELLQQFHRYSDHVHVERTTHGEFDYLVYFEDGVPDDYRYCITDEGCHLIYHRFTPEDYEDFQF